MQARTTWWPTQDTPPQCKMSLVERDHLRKEHGQISTWRLLEKLMRVEMNPSDFCLFPAYKKAVCRAKCQPLPGPLQKIWMKQCGLCVARQPPCISPVQACASCSSSSSSSFLSEHLCEELVPAFLYTFRPCSNTSALLVDLYLSFNHCQSQFPAFPTEFLPKTKNNKISKTK